MATPEDQTPSQAQTAVPGDSRSKSGFQYDVLEKPGDQIGDFKLLTVLGEGGFGTVWLAERKTPFTQRVALKLIKAGMDSKAVIARFEQERQVLAVMSHPNIATVLGGGLTPSGRPYFVMEYVVGQPISEFCDHHKLDIEARLRLFITVCEAVQHAHTKGIIHRDLKPSNILVQHVDGNPVAKIIDFGVAKAITHTLTAASIFTEHGRMIGTPEYMSPEQSDVGSVDVDTRSDVYSLGIILYELLAGSLPFESRTLRSAGAAEIRRIIKEVEAPKPSTKLSADLDRALLAATNRGIKIEELRHTLTQELEWIPLKALRKDRERRYASASALGDDVRNFLEGKPLLAGPESSVYRTKKWVGRHRAMVATAAVLVLVITGSAIVSTTFFFRERAAKMLAEQRETEIRHVAEFQQNMLSELDPETAGRQLIGIIDEAWQMPDPAKDQVLRSLDSTAMATNFLKKSVLTPANQAIQTRYMQLPLVQASLFQGLGESSFNLDSGESEAAFHNAITLRQQQLPPSDRLTLYSQSWLAQAKSNLMQEQKEPEAIQQEVLGKRVQLFGANDPDTLTSYGNIASIYEREGKLKEAEEYFRKAEQGWLALRGAKSEEAVNARTSLGIVLKEQDQLDAAVAVLAEASKDGQSLLYTSGKDKALLAQWNYALALKAQAMSRKDAAGLAQVKALYADLLEKYAARYGKDHSQYLDTQLSIATLLIDQGQFADARKEVESAFETANKSPTVQASIITRALQALTVIGGKDGESQVAKRCYESARFIKPNSLAVMNVALNLGAMLRKNGDFSDAEKIVKNALQVDATSDRNSGSSVRWMLNMELLKIYKGWTAKDPKRTFAVPLAATQKKLDELNAFRQSQSPPLPVPPAGYVDE